MQDIRAANPGSDLVLPDAVAKHIKALTELHTPKAAAVAKPTGQDTRANDLADALLQEKTAFERESNLYAERDKMLALYHSKFGTADNDYYAGREAARAEYITSEAASYAKEVALAEGFRAKNPVEIAANKTKLDTLLKDHLNFLDKMAKARTEDDAARLADQKKLYDDMSKAIATAGDGEIKALDASIAKQQEHNAEIGKSKDQIELARAAKADEATASMQLEAHAIDALLTQSDLTDMLQGQDRDLYSQRLSYLDRIIVKRQEEADLLRTGAALEQQAVKNDQQLKLLDSVDRTAQTVFASLLEGGSNTFKNLGKSLKTNLIDMLYELTLKKWVLNIGANIISSVTGSAASAAANSAVGSATGSAGNALGSLAGNVAGSAGSSAITSWLSSSFPQASAVLTNFSNGAIASAQSAIGITGTQAQMASSLSSAGAAGGDAAATSLGSSLGAYVPYVAAALVIASQWKNIFGGKVSNNGSGIQGDFSSSGFAGVNYSDMHKSGGLLGSSRDWTDTSALDTTLQSALGTAYQGILTQTDSYAATLGLQATALDSYVGHIRVSTKGLSSDQAIAALQTELKAQQEALAALALGTQQYNKLGESSADALTRLSSSLSTANSWFVLLGEHALSASLAGADAASKLADLLGGISNLSSAQQSFYDTYTSDADKANKSQAQMRQQLSAVGLTLPDNKAAFKALADSLDLTTDAGRKAYAVMLAVAPQFAQTLDLAAQAADAAAKTLADTFTGRTGVVPALDVAHLSAQSLQDQLLALQLGADKARIDITALSASLSGVSMTEYVAVLDNIFTALSTRLQSVVDAINTERTAVSNAALQIINPTVLSRDEIARRVASVNTTLPSNAGVVAAQNTLGAADAAVVQKQAAQATANAAYTAAAAAQSSAVAGYAAVADRFHAMATYYGTSADHDLGFGLGTNNAYNYDPSTGRLLSWTGDGWGTGGQSGANQFNKDARAAASGSWTSSTGIIGTPDGVVSGNGQIGSLVYQLENANATLVPLWNTLQAAAAAQTTAAAATAAAQSTQAAATSAAAAAAVAYTAALQSFTVDAGKSVTNLTNLREETVKYYEAQAKLASLMTASADGIRKTVSDYQLTQMTDAQKYASLASQFAQNYSMALATTGETAAGYADKLNSLINPIIEAANAVGSSSAVGGASADSLVASYLAQANAVATRLDSNVTGLGNYQTDSLNLLGNIDATLAVLDASSKSAEAIISDAVKAGADQTAAGLRAVIAAITGQTIPEFATGGAFTGSVVSRPTMFDMGLMGEAGPEGILPLTSVGGKLGVHARISGKGQAHGQPINQDALLAELQALRAQVAELHQVLDSNTGTIAINTGKTARLHARWDADGMPESAAMAKV